VAAWSIRVCELRGGAAAPAGFCDGREKQKAQRLAVGPDCLRKRSPAKRMRDNGQQDRIVSRRAYGAVCGSFSAGPHNGAEMGRGYGIGLGGFLFIFFFSLFCFPFEFEIQNLNLLCGKASSD
jgi:hypothetical protein